MFKNILLFFIAWNIIEGIVQYFRNNMEDTYLCAGSGALDMLIVLIIDKCNGVQYSFFGFNLYDWPIFIIGVLCLIILVWALNRLTGHKITWVVRGKDGSIVTDENGNPITGDDAKEYVKKTKVPEMVIKIDGEVNKEASKAATEYMQNNWLNKKGKWKKKDKNGRKVTQEDIMRDIQRYIFKEWAPANGYEVPPEKLAEIGEEPNPVSEEVQNLLNLTTGDVVRKLDNHALAEFMYSVFHGGCDNCEDKARCQAMSEEEREQVEIQCIEDMLGEKVFEDVVLGEPGDNETPGEE